ncbi:hypothetical protein [Flavobacterium sharifuzzamanii]|uniref:hypothetical protein n=1 Tax=Flavobacterium sharifuzzamanii TaxID=2211133 RepID=UPI000DAB4C7C|nr:hypothetical protein [Flavobacterium sharifuzzamanii]KAF2082635.1 hypothetical protein DMA14_03145 [Flavobacterium sharifuzzamanii]
MKIENTTDKNKDDKSLLNDFQKKAIDEALDNIEKGKVLFHDEVVEETKKRFPHLFNRVN